MQSCAVLRREPRLGIYLRGNELSPCALNLRASADRKKRQEKPGFELGRVSLYTPFPMKKGFDLIRQFNATLMLVAVIALTLQVGIACASALGSSGDWLNEIRVTPSVHRGNQAIAVERGDLDEYLLSPPAPASAPVRSDQAARINGLDSRVNRIASMARMHLRRPVSIADRTSA